MPCDICAILCMLLREFCVTAHGCHCHNWYHIDSLKSNGTLKNLWEKCQTPKWLEVSKHFSRVVRHRRWRGYELSGYMQHSLETFRNSGVEMYIENVCFYTLLLMNGLHRLHPNNCCSIHLNSCFHSLFNDCWRQSPLTSHASVLARY